jgi:hypothetical protein
MFMCENEDKYPNLDPSFISQICFEHPDRFDDLLPEFDPERHSAVRVGRSLGWVYDNVRYDHNAELDFWHEQFDAFRESEDTRYEIFAHMMQTGTWPLPPVIIKAEFALRLGASKDIGKPYHLIEGTHRASYARRMVQVGLTSRNHPVEVIELMPNEQTWTVP